VADALYLRCVRCDASYGKDSLTYRCRCGGSLDLVLRYVKDFSWMKFRSRRFRHWRYAELFPLLKKGVSLDEGGTPLLASVHAKNAFLKLEGLNPTGSFKDRGSTIEVSHALSLGKKRLLCATTGNMGASIAAFSARAGIEAEIFVPSHTPDEKLRQIHQHGASITRVRGQYSDAAEAAFWAFKRGRGFLVGDYAYRAEGEKSIAYELCDQLGKAPDYVLAPMGNGTLISSLWKGFKELRMLGLTARLPKMIGVQSRQCPAIVTAFKAGKKYTTGGACTTIAGAIACGDPLDGEKALTALRESKGTALALTDNELLLARRKMARTEGIDAELAGVAPWAALKKLKLPANATKALIISGHGLKDLHHI
jgi:threonine synthase